MKSGIIISDIPRREDETEGTLLEYIYELAGELETEIALYEIITYHKLNTKNNFLIIMRVNNIIRKRSN